MHPDESTLVSKGRPTHFLSNPISFFSKFARYFVDRRKKLASDLQNMSNKYVHRRILTV